MVVLPATPFPAMGDDVAWPEDAVEVGRIADAFGIKGWVRVQPYSSQPEALFSSKRWFVQPPADRPRPAGAAPLPRLLRVSQVQEHGDTLVAQLRDVDDRNAAEALKGARLFVSRSSFPSTGDSEFYWVDLIGLQVVNRQGEDLGKVVDLLDTGAHSVLRVVLSQPEEQERLIPFVQAYIDSVDLPGQRIVADWGLDY